MPSLGHWTGTAPESGKQLRPGLILRPGGSFASPPWLGHTGKLDLPTCHTGPNSPGNLSIPRSLCQLGLQRSDQRSKLMVNLPQKTWPGPSLTPLLLQRPPESHRPDYPPSPPPFPTFSQDPSPPDPPLPTQAPPLFSLPPPPRVLRRPRPSVRPRPPPGPAQVPPFCSAPPLRRVLRRPAPLFGPAPSAGSCAGSPAGSR